MNTISTIAANLPQPFSALSSLLKAEEEESKRIRVSRVGWWRDVIRLSGSTLPRIWRATLVFTLWAALVALGEFVFQFSLGLTNNVTPLLSVVVGLLLVFRNTSAFARWDEGRHAFTALTATIRSMARQTLINVAAPHPEARLASDGSLKPMPALDRKPHHATSKEIAVRLQVAFAVAVRRHVRGEYGLQYDDLRQLLPPQFHDARLDGGEPPKTPRSVRSFDESQIQEYARLSPVLPLADDDSSTSTENRPLLGRRHTKHHPASASKRVMEQLLSKPSLPLPLVIAHELSTYYAHCKATGLLESIGPAGLNALQQNVNSLVNSFVKIERLATTRVPAMYGIHLKQCVTAFLLTLPFVLVETLKYKMIPWVTVTAAIFLGVEGLASELENPFGIDGSDLPLDLWCAELRNEIEHLIRFHGEIEERTSSWY